MPQPTKDRLIFLDSLRGGAALYVLLFHVHLSPMPNLDVPNFIRSAITYGGTGVWLFFVISAFSLSLTMPRHVATTAPIWSFAVSRFFRIAPLFYVLIGFQLFREGWQHWQNRTWLELMVNLTFTFNLSPDYMKSIVWGGWAIGPEMLFYIAFPVIYYFHNNLYKKIAIAIFAVATYYLFCFFAPRFFNDPAPLEAFKYRTILRHIPNFMIGLIVFDLWSQIKHSNHAREIGYATLTAGIILTAVFIYLRPSFFPFDRSHIESIAYGCILLGAGLSRPRWMETKAMAFYGRISFSIYLWHIPVIFFMTPALRQMYRHDIPSGVSYLSASVLVIAITTVIATISYRLIERPCEMIGKRIIAFAAPSETKTSSFNV